MGVNKGVRIDIQSIAREKLGFDFLRPGQKEAVEAILGGSDTLVVQPTGSGKSAIYQLAGLLIEGTTVVISPLIALQKDQVQSIESGVPAEAIALNSMAGQAGMRETLNRLENGAAEYIFLAPEQLAKQETIERLKSAGVSLFVVDEAHCVSEWGHDFRPDYLRLCHVIEALQHPRIVALTATASPAVRHEIVDRLRMREPRILVQGFDRPNIFLRVDKFKAEHEKREALIRHVRWADKPGVIYVGTRKTAQEIRDELAGDGMEAVFYHGGLRAKERDQVQERFMSGYADVIVATDAFGMGVDKPDIRFVYHYHAPESLDAYYQEIGRGGRDGAKAEAILFYRRQDIGAQSFKTGAGKIHPEEIERIAAFIKNADKPVRPEEIAKQLKLSKRKLISLIQQMEDTEIVRTLSNGEVCLHDSDDIAGRARQVVENQQRLQEVRRERLDLMRSYADTAHCRRELLLRYFGDDYTGPCHTCDNCQAAEGAEPDQAEGGIRREVV